MFGFQVCLLSEKICAIFQIERHTYGLFQCHPFPSEFFIDTARKGHHCAFFMGLRQKQGAAQQERQ